MARFRDKASISEIETLDKSCPVCRSDVKGSDAYLFYCQKCNMLFKREELFLENPDRLKDIIKKKIIEKYEKDREKIKIEKEPIKLKKIKHIIHHRTDHVFVASKSSKKLHVPDCLYAKKIKAGNKDVFHSLEEAKKHKNYEKCHCIKKL